MSAEIWPTVINTGSAGQGPVEGGHAWLLLLALLFDNFEHRTRGCARAASEKCAAVILAQIWSDIFIKIIPELRRCNCGGCEGFHLPVKLKLVPSDKVELFASQTLPHDKDLNAYVDAVAIDKEDRPFALQNKNFPVWLNQLDIGNNIEKRLFRIDRVLANK